MGSQDGTHAAKLSDKFSRAWPDIADIRQRITVGGAHQEVLMSKMLSGVRVIDLTNILSGPLCSHHMAMLGADVIKVERPVTGDLSRKFGADSRLNAKLMGVSFCAVNAGKKSITLNLKHEEGKDIFKRLVSDADVVMENFLPGTMKSLGLDYEVLKEVNPGLIYCALSGFGQTGPLSHRPTYDQIIQGFCGIMSLTGDPDTAPIRSGYTVCDTMASIMAAFGICAALYRKQKTGKGDMIDVSMLDATLSTMATWIISNYLNARQVPVPRGNENQSASPSGTFRTADGLLNIVNNEEKHFHRLCDAVGLPDLKSDTRFSSRDARLRNREELKTLLEQALQKKSSAEWDRLLDEVSVPAGPILTVPQIVAHPQVENQQLIKRFADVPGVGRDIAVTRIGFRLASGLPDVATPPPQLGQDTVAILNGIGRSSAEIEELRQRGVI